MAQRLVRAKRKIRNAGIPFGCRRPHQLVDRTARRAGRPLPPVQRGLLGHARAPTWSAQGLTRRGHPPGPDPVHPDARRARGARPARAHAVPRRPPRGPGRRRRRPRRPGASRTARCGTTAAIAEGRRRARRGARACAGPGPSRCRRPSPPATSRRRRPTTDWAEIAALYDHLVRDGAVGRRRAEPGRRRLHGRGSRGGPGPGRAHRARTASCAATTCSRRRGPTCCAASVAERRRPTPTGRPATWRAPTPSAATWSAACRGDAASV